MLRSSLIAALLLAVVGCSEPSAEPPARIAPTTHASKPIKLSPCDSLAAYRKADAQGHSAPTGEEGPPSLTLVRSYLMTCASERVTALATQLMRFPTVSEQESPSDGPAFRAMQAFLADWSQKHGLNFRVVGPNDAWEITLGAGKRRLGFVMHADVVPAGSLPPAGPPEQGKVQLPAGWSHPPFDGTVGDGRLWGRGSEDDKGPIAAVLTVLASLAEAGVTPQGQILAILGTAEESDWDGMERYVGTQPLPQEVISVDAGFPVVIGESGFVAWHLGLPLTPTHKSGGAVIIRAQGGEFLTQVPGSAFMQLLPPGKESLEGLLARAQKAVDDESKSRGDGFTLSAAIEGEGDEKAVVVRTTGTAVHSSEADKGHNALWPLAKVAQRLKVEANGFGQMLALIAKKLDGDHFGEKLGLAYEHPVMGRLLVAATVLKREDDKVVLSINMRRPVGQSSEEFSHKLDATLAKLKRDVDPRLTEARDRYVGEPVLSATESPLVTTLLDIYRQATGDAAAGPITIRGGTYARLFPGGVSFGPSFPEQPYRGHAPDESIALADLSKLTVMLFDTTMRIAYPSAVAAQ